MKTNATSVARNIERRTRHTFIALCILKRITCERENLRIARLHDQLAKEYASHGIFAMASLHASQALERVKITFGRISPEYANEVFKLAQIESHLKNKIKARNAIQDAQEVYKKLCPRKEEKSPRQVSKLKIFLDDDNERTQVELESMLHYIDHL
mmetsp:Transcript_4731/g.7515  ORF Transcript_4731/g.7515 Transcript_4731/m.7515 type:complete len:155 (-) Transcript_4731:93-557(-)